MSVDPVVRDSVSIILVEPQYPGNIGMVCRAMKNMGLNELRLVNPCDYNHPEAYKFAVSARDLLDRAAVFSSLSEALADSPLSIGTTRRHGKYRPEIISPEQVAQRILPEMHQHRAALVFGREDSGLTTDELSLCILPSRFLFSVTNCSNRARLTNSLQVVKLPRFRKRRGF
jgi:tRNA/rRNA methyltransferase